jgi:hypothetical protein
MVNKCPNTANLVLEAGLRITDWFGWTPHDLGPTLALWLFGSGLWLGDRTTQRSSMNHQVCVLVWGMYDIWICGSDVN